MAISSPVPIEKSVFTYNIIAPYQTVLHRLFKANSTLDIDGYGQLEATYAIQEDSRQEFTSDIAYNPAYAGAPEDNFLIESSTADLIWHLPEHKGFSGDVGSVA